MAARRVAITGLGIVSPLGLNLADTWQGLREGRSAIGPITSINPLKVNLKINNGAQVHGFDPLKHFEGGKDAQLDRFAQF
ncbi:MAG: beta-ketoacyl synthase N-terminal-like domain-containing protein, partial [Candidatus Acidiferrales bacterium]